MHVTGARRVDDVVVDCVTAAENYLFVFFVFFFTHTATTEIYTLSLHDALPICRAARNDLP